MNEHGGSDPSTTLDPAEIDTLLATLDHHPAQEHVAVYDQVHSRLRDHLRSVPDAGAPTD
ncbi:hypothetical protein BH24ACT12_BH24ACT12_29210 [soil metagenome]|jgi:hypothetical protein